MNGMLVNMFVQLVEIETVLVGEDRGVVLEADELLGVGVEQRQVARCGWRG